jgi:hypothetical protein
LRSVFFTVAAGLAVVVRSLLLWITLPVTVIVWFVSLPVLLIWRSRGSSKGELNPGRRIAYSTQILDAALARVLLRPLAESVDWPWRDPDARANASPLSDLY